MAECSKKRVAIVGSGNWGSAVARIIGVNVSQRDAFMDDVKMWVFEEMVGDRKLTEIINTEHENTKYLAGFKIPANVTACPDIVETVKDADILVFVMPHQFVRRSCETINSHVKKGAFAISLIKGLDTAEGSMQLISAVITKLLGVDTSVLMGANIAMDVAREDFCEATIGSKDPQQGELFRQLFNRPHFRVNIVPDVSTVELCGALKNIVACAAGIVDGLKFGSSTKAAVIRIGLLEMWNFIDTYYHMHGTLKETLMESCGLADLIATSFGGRNRRLAEALVFTGKPIEQLEAEMLNGQKLQGPPTAKEVHEILEKDGKLDEFPLFTAVYRIFYENHSPTDILKEIVGSDL